MHVRRAGRVALTITFVVYLVMIGRLFFANRPVGFYPMNLVPFATLWTYLAEPVHPFSVWFSNVVGNVLVFMPFGFALPLLSDRMRRAVRVVALTFAASLAVELTQLSLSVGSFDVDDILLNTLGGLFGYASLRVAISVYRQMRG